MIQRTLHNGRIRVIVGLALLAGLIIQCQRALTADDSSVEALPASAPRKPDPSMAFAAPAVIQPREGETLEAMAARDPLGFFQMALGRYDRTVRDYTCTFTKQELVSGKLTDEQVMNAMFREKPFSVRLEWKKNADKCSRVLYVADQWIEKGQQMAVVEPAGSIAQLFVSYVMRPINGDEARKSSRRTLDQFGLRNSLELTLKYARLSQEKNVLNFSFKGTGEVDGRQTLTFERRLPYVDDKGLWPDRVLEVQIDRELLVPLLCTAYADDAKKVLLGRYKTSAIKLNTNLPDSTFTKEGMGF